MIETRSTSPSHPATQPAARPRGDPPAPARIQLCGPLEAQIAGCRVDPALPGRKGRLLFAYLVIGRERPIRRDELIDAVWPESAPVDPDAAFCTLLTRMRAALGHDALRSRGELRLDLGPDAAVDWEIARDSVGAAEARLAAGDAEGALALASAGLTVARRPLLPEIGGPWVEDRRRELVEWHAALLETSARAALRLGGEHLRAAERTARELIDREPYRESAYALLMETHAAQGNVAEALRVYDGLRRLLREELGLTPSDAVTRLASRLLEAEARPSERAPAPAFPPALAELAGRLPAAQRERLSAAVGALLAVLVDLAQADSPPHGG